jgi:hypothetical protein
MTDQFEPLWSDAELEAHWGKKPSYMAEQRAQGRGPAFIKLSPRVIRYRPSVIREYEERNTFASNAEAMAAADDDSPEAAYR